MSANPQPVVVTIDDTNLSRIETIADELRAAGLTVGNVLATSGVITGEVDPAKVASLRSVKGVAAIESDDEMRAI